jgi:hypothetical protein
LLLIDAVMWEAEQITGVHVSWSQTRLSLLAVGCALFMYRD